MLVVLCGFAGSGKDTVADWLMARGWRKMSFAATLKDAVAAIFGWPRDMLEGATVESRSWRDQVDAWWARRLNIPHLTPRWVLQNIGTEVMRGHFHDDIWIAAVERAIENHKGPIVITDCRFPNEFRAMCKYGCQIYDIRRGPPPPWFQSLRDGEITRPPVDLHASEWAWISEHTDATIMNDGTLEELYDQLSKRFN